MSSRNSILAGVALTLFLSGCANQAGVKEGGDGAIATEIRSTDRLAEINTQLGVEYMKEGKYETALKKLEKAVEIDGNYARAYDVLGLLYARLGENVNAEQNFKRALQLAPNDSSILNNYGQFLCRNGSAAEGQAMFAKAVENPLYQTPQNSYTNAAICALEQQKDKAAAQEFLRKALEKDPEMPIALLRMSQVTYESDNYMAAKGYFERYKQVASHTPESLFLGVQIEQKLGDSEAADNYAMLLRDKFPDSQEAHQLMKSEQ
ncbi:MAG: type IV pilus biogenesis/stability protein PilW [Gammaproteobacteria bacterium]